MGSADVQGALWGGAPHDWATYQEPAFLPLWKDVLRAVNARDGMKILDAGCGAGGACVEANKIGCQIIGIDASEALLEIARKRTPTARFQKADIESLPFGDAEFDAVMAVNSILYATDMAQAMKELTRVTRPDGKVVITNWGKLEDCEVRDVIDAVVRLVRFKPPRGPFSLSEPGMLEGLLEGAGLTVAERGESRCDFIYPSLEICWRAQASSGPLRAAMNVLGEPKVRTAVEGAVKSHTDQSGTIMLRNTFIWASGSHVAQEDPTE